MDKSGKKYWAVFQGRDVLFEGSFNECWEYLCEQCAEETVRALSAKGDSHRPVELIARPEHGVKRLDTSTTRKDAA